MTDYCKEAWYKWKPYFNIELDLPCPYIWLGWFLITWDNNSIDISFMPD